MMQETINIIEGNDHMKILVTPTSMQKENDSPAITELKKFTNDIVFNDKGRPLKEDELIAALNDCDGYLAGLDNVTEKVFESCPKLKVISRYGVGCDRIDLKSAEKHGVIVTNTPGANAEAVGELTVALLLSVVRRIPTLDRDTKKAVGCVPWDMNFTVRIFAFWDWAQ